MIWIGIDDTDIVGSPGTNQMARAIVAALADQFTCRFVLRHQLLDNPRVPYTSKNGSASIELFSRSDASSGPATITTVADICETVMLDRFVVGSDPGLCVVSHVPESVQNFGQRCQADVVRQADAQQLADEKGIFLKGLGGTNGGIIGALAAVGLAATRDNGRVVVYGTMPEVTGLVTVQQLTDWGIVVQEIDSGQSIRQGTVDLVKKLRPNIHRGKVVLWVRHVLPGDSPEATFVAVKK